MGQPPTVSQRNVRKAGSVNLIVGASGGLGRRLAEQLAQQKQNLLLVSSDARDLCALATDLKIRFEVQAEILEANLSTREGVDQFLDDLKAHSQQLNAAFFPLGYSLTADQMDLTAQQIDAIFSVNLISTIKTVQVLMAVSKNPTLTLAFFGSIAQSRGRNGNIVYASAKRGLTSFFESLKHRSFQKGQVRPYLFQIGYMESQQTLGKKLLFPVSDPNGVAATVLTKIKTKPPGEFYVPGFWRLFCSLLRALPWSVYSRLKF